MGLFRRTMFSFRKMYIFFHRVVQSLLNVAMSSEGANVDASFAVSRLDRPVPVSVTCYVTGLPTWLASHPTRAFPARPPDLRSQRCLLTARTNLYPVREKSERPAAFPRQA
jgi:hypothetical protein